MCVNLTIVDDSIDEPTEQFEFYFDNLPSDFATVGDPPAACVNIEDNDCECKLSDVFTQGNINWFLIGSLDEYYY